MLRYLCRFLICISCLVGLSVPTISHGQSAPVIDPVLSQAQFAIDEAEYEKALNWIRQGLKRSDLSTKSLLRLYWMEGTCYISLGINDKALGSFRKLLAIAPQYQASPMTPPKILRIFEQAKTEQSDTLQNNTTLQPRSTPVGHHEAQTDVSIQLVIDGSQNKALIERVTLFVRIHGQLTYTPLSARATDENKQTFISTIPGDWLVLSASNYDMEYYWEIVGNHNKLLATLGTAPAPLTFTVLPPTPVKAPASQATEANAPNTAPIYIALAVSTLVIAGIVTAVVLSQPQTANAQVTVSCETGNCFP
jgi:hypothetical protein